MLLNLNGLKKALDGCGVNVELWGKGKAKTVSNLLEEIRKKESQLVIDEKGISRVVGIAKMIICDPNRPERGSLIELSQRLPDGRIRKRNQQPSEKIKGKESPEEAVVRGIKEELHIGRGGYRLFSIPPKVESIPSPSYPGLPCYYTVHRFKVVLRANSPALEESFTITEKDGTFHLFGWGEPSKNIK